MIDSIEITIPYFGIKNDLKCINIYEEEVPQGFALLRTYFNNQEEGDKQPYQRIVRIESLRVFVADANDDYSNDKCVKVCDIHHSDTYKTRWETISS